MESPEYRGPLGMDIEPNERSLAMLCHLLALLVGFLGPLILWLVKREESAFIDDQGKESLNFTIATTIAYMILGVTGAFLCIPLFLIPVIVVLHIIWGIQGCIAANKGEPYRYPMNWRIVT